MRDVNRINIDGLSITETRVSETNMKAGNIVYLNDDKFEVGADVDGKRLYVANTAWQMGLDVHAEIPRGSSVIADYAEEGREFFIRAAVGDYKKDDALTIGATGGVAKGTEKIFAYAQETFKIEEDQDLLRVRIA